MSNICGWLGPVSSRPKNAKILEKMALALDVNYGQRYQATSEISGLALVSSHDQAFFFESSEITVALTGKPYSDEITASGHSDPETVAQKVGELYQKIGREILTKLKGSFSLCIFEAEKQKALIAVDRLGIAPLAFTSNAKQLIFSSKIDGILQHPAIAPDLSNQALFSYLYFHMVPSPATIYQGISKLLPGEYLEFEKGQITRDFYWSPDYQEKSVSEAELAAELRDSLENAVQRCMDGQSLGTFLSGGLDSSAITGVYRKLAGRKTDAFSIGFQAEGYDEMAFARASAKHFDINLHEYYLTADDVVDAIPRIAKAYDEPFGNASAVPTYYCAKIAREFGKTCLLAGDGGDEVFAGNARYTKQKIFDLYRLVPDIFRSIIEPVAFGVPLLGKLKSYIEQAKIPMPDRMETYNFLHRTPSAEVLHPDFIDRVDPKGPVAELGAVYARAQTDSLVKKMLFLDLKFTLADNDLRKVNRMSELAGIDVHYPLLDEEVVALAGRVPSAYLMRRFELRSFFRNTFADFLAPETMNKSKHGFGLPFGPWLNEHSRLKEFANFNLTKFRERQILNPNYLDQIIKAHSQGDASYYGVMIWILIMLEQWFQAHPSN